MIKLNRIKIILFSIINIIFILFSGCSEFNINNNSYNNIPSIDTSGYGLEINLNLDDKWISTREIGFDLSLKNTGIEPITLTRNNIKLNTLSVNNPIDNLNSFTNNLFKNNEQITIYHDQDFPSISSGVFKINKKYYHDLTNSDIILNLDINYDYLTKFSNNVQVNLKTKSLTIMDTLSQAAPIKIEKIIFKPTETEKKYEIGFYISDKSKSPNIISTETKFNSIKFKFGEQDLNNCKVLTKGTNEIFDLYDFKSYKLNKKNKEIIIICPINLNQYSKSEIKNTIISGILKYNENIHISQTIQLPTKRNNENQW